MPPPTFERDFKGSSELEADIAEGYRELAEMRGYHFPAYEWLGRNDPDFERARFQYIRMTYTRPNAVLPVKYKELIASTILAYIQYPSVKAHYARALREGATLHEIIEALEMAAIPGGMPMLHFGIEALMELQSEQPELFQTE